MGRPKLPWRGCSVPECERPHNSGGLCRMHRKQQLKGQDPRPARVPLVECAFAGCDRPHEARGLCSTHFDQRRKNRPLTAIRHQRTGCSMDRCDGNHHANGLCRAHNERRRRGSDDSGPIHRNGGGNDIVLGADHAKIILRRQRGTTTEACLVDADDVPIVSVYRWWRTGNTVRGYRIGAAETAEVSLVRLLMGLTADDDREVSLWDGDGLNCRRVNLRVVDTVGAKQNQVRRSDNTSGYRGVSWDSNRNAWKASYKVGYQNIVVGYYDDLHTAGAAAHAARETAMSNHRTREYIGERGVLDVLP